MTSNTIAGKRIIPCPHCGAAVREDLMASHRQRCTVFSKKTKGTNSSRPSPTSQNTKPPLNSVKKAKGKVKSPAGQNTNRVSTADTAQAMQSTTHRPARTSQDRNDRAVNSSRASAKAQPLADGRKQCPYCKLQVPVPHYADHVDRCHGKRSTNTQASASPRTKSTYTHDGYPIDTCWDCGRRVCLVQIGNETVRVYDIAPGSLRGELHLCTGSRPVGRRTQLTYVNSRLGSIAPDGKKHGPRKI